MKRFRGAHAMFACALAVAALLSGCTPAVTPESTVSTTPPATQPPASPEPTADAPAAVVTISSVDPDGKHVTVGGFVTLIEETGADCTFDLVSAIDQRTVTAGTTSEANVRSTSCGVVQIDISQVSKGPWDAVLHYSSPTVKLDSPPVRLEVP